MRRDGKMKKGKKQYRFTDQLVAETEVDRQAGFMQ